MYFPESKTKSLLVGLTQLTIFKDEKSCLSDVESAGQNCNLAGRGAGDPHDPILGLLLRIAIYDIQ